MKNYPHTWLKSRNNTEANIEGNSINVSHVEYQNYLNAKENTLQNNLKKYTIYLIHLT